MLSPRPGHLREGSFPLAQISSVKEVRLTRMPLKALRLGIRLVLALLS